MSFLERSLLSRVEAHGLGIPTEYRLNRGNLGMLIDPTARIPNGPLVDISSFENTV